MGKTALRPFTIRFSQMIGRQEFDKAIDYLRGGLKGNASDLSSLEMIAHCHLWAGHKEDALAACRMALQRDPNSFDMHAMLAQLLAEKGEHDDAAIHVRKGLESYPEPLPEIPHILMSAIQILSRIFPFLRSANPNDALRRVEAERGEWFSWAQQYLGWYDSTSGGKLKPTKH